jgi:type II secretory pathway component PulM
MINELIDEIINNWSSIPFEDMEKWLNSLKEKYGE